ncbi:MAG: hypothetical protein NTZ18_04670 [Candidatus Komeilibacteria bacterium]|nr:hypothetical protein [Candidatus Komeilibacteria bacterium]
MDLFIKIILPILTFIIGCVASVYLPKKFRKEDRIPKISISPLQEHQLYFDITNHGGDILNLNIEIFWLQEGVKQNRKMENFFGPTEDPTFGHSHKANSLKKGETKKVIGCPSFSDNGEVAVIIMGNDINGKTYSEKLTLKNNIRQV